MIPFEAHLAHFERIVQLGREELIYRESIGDKARRRVFTFDMDLAHLLHFTAMTCRVLPLRLEAMDLMDKLARPRETLWDSNVMRAINRRTIEREHAIRLPLELQGNWQTFLRLNTIPLVDDDQYIGVELDEDSQWDAQTTMNTGEELNLSANYYICERREDLTWQMLTFVCPQYPTQSSISPM